jgi:hypothetical protein
VATRQVQVCRRSVVLGFKQAERDLSTFPPHHLDTTTTTTTTMTTISASALDLLETLQERIQEQQEAIKIISSDDNDNDNEEEKQRAKDRTKSALFALLATISSAAKADLSPETRQQIDTELMSMVNDTTATKNNVALFKWPLVRALEDPSHHYRAFLGLPKTMEQTRRFLTQISVEKLREILGTNLGLGLASLTNVQEFTWVEEVLHFMTGDGRRKKELGGFVLLDKSVVRGALNHASRLRKDLEKNQRNQAKPSQDNKPAQREVQYELERDVRVIDQERAQARANGIGTLIDDALLRK